MELRMSNLKNRNLRAFTITEILIALAVIGVLTAVLMPIIHSLVPDQNILMAKRTFYTVETVVNSIINDTGCYPPTRVRTGFEDGHGYRRCALWGINSADSANTKFIKLFTDKMGNQRTTAGTITTKDGVSWTISNVSLTTATGTANIIVDVNGDKDPNCGQVATSTVCTDGRDKGFDKYTMVIHANGKIDISDAWAQDAVKTDKKIIGNN